MIADSLTAQDFLRSYDFEKAREYAYSGFNTNPKNKDGVLLKVDCTRIKIWTDLFRVARDRNLTIEDLVTEAGKIIKLHLDTLLNDTGVLELWNTFPFVHFNPSKHFQKENHDAINAIRRDFYPILSFCKEWVSDEKSGNLAEIHTRYLPKRELSLPLHKDNETFMFITLKMAKDHLHVEVMDFNEKQKICLQSKRKVSMDPSKASSWQLLFLNGNLSLVEIETESKAVTEQMNLLVLHSSVSSSDNSIDDMDVDDKIEAEENGDSGMFIDICSSLSLDEQPVEDDKEEKREEEDKTEEVFHDAETNLEEYFEQEESISKAQIGKMKKLLQDKDMAEYVEGKRIAKTELYTMDSTTNNFGPIQYLIDLFKLDFRCRKQNVDDSESTDGTDEEDEEESDGEDLFSNTARISKGSSIKDTVLMGLNCCDEFLLQEAFRKMAECQLAIPVLMPSLNMDEELVYHMWASRSIAKQWIKNSQTELEGHVSSKNFQTVSFVRFGQLASSKTKVINSFLTEAQGKALEKIFLTRDEDEESKLSAGTIEMSWFTPEYLEEGKERLQDLTCIYNLRYLDYFINFKSITLICLGVMQRTSNIN